MKLYIWGIGNSTKRVLKNLKVDVEGFIESTITKPEYNNKKVYQPKDIKDYDCIVITSSYVNEIYEKIIELNLELNKIIFTHYCTLMNKNNSLLARQVFNEEEYQRYVAMYNYIEDSFFVQDRKKYMLLNNNERFLLDKNNDRPILTDKYADMGKVDQYFWQDLWAALLINKNRPNEHFDIGSRLDGFIAHILAMGIPIKVIDVRPVPQKIPGLSTIVADATMLNELRDSSVESISALCSIEHFGLGRYGDPINPNACFLCFENIQKKIMKAGHIYIAVPIGKEKLQFNAHRIFYASTIIEAFSECDLVEFSCCDNKLIEYNVDIHKYDEENNQGERFGLFYFRKR